MGNEPKTRDPNEDNTGREFERLIDQMYGREVDEDEDEKRRDDDK